MKSNVILLVTSLLFNCNDLEKQTHQSECEWCGAHEAPENLPWFTTIAKETERGERIKIQGIVYKADKKTPAKDVILYFYHTNVEGIYPKLGDEKGNARRHGYLRGWIKTNENGEYRIETIKPAPYPGRTEPAHIHLTVKEPKKDEYWLDSYLFVDDSLLTEQDLRRKDKGNRFDHILSLEKENQVLSGRRDIVLKN